MHCSQVKTSDAFYTILKREGKRGINGEQRIQEDWNPGDYL